MLNDKIDTGMGGNSPIAVEIQDSLNRLENYKNYTQQITAMSKQIEPLQKVNAEITLVAGGIANAITIDKDMLECVLATLTHYCRNAIYESKKELVKNLDTVYGTILDSTKKGCQHD